MVPLNSPESTIPEALSWEKNCWTTVTGLTSSPWIAESELVIVLHVIRRSGSASSNPIEIPIKRHHERIQPAKKPSHDLPNGIDLYPSV